MRTMSVISTQQKIIDLFTRSLSSTKKYRNVSVDYSSGSITAERKDNLLGRRYKIALKVKQVRDVVTNIEMTINPHHLVPKQFDRETEEKLENKFIAFI
jgi:hypothetical protein